jgi:hypothetical protein
MSLSTAYCNQCRRLLYLGQKEDRFCPVCSSPVVVTGGDGNANLQRRLARNEASFRHLNEVIERSANGDGHRRARFVCECADENCTEGVELTLAEYQDVRRDPSRFLVVIGHEDERLEVTITRNGGYSVVEKAGPARGEAERTDPRT